MTTPNDKPARRIRDNPPNAVCSFCGKHRAQAGMMVEGPNKDQFISRACSDLIQNLFRMIDEQQQEAKH